MKLDKERALKELGIPQEMYDELVQLFIEQTQNTLKSLDEFIQAGNFPEIAKAAHFIKGSAGNLRLDELYALSKEIEFGAKENKAMAEIESMAKNLNRAFSELKTLIAK